MTTYIGKVLSKAAVDLSVAVPELGFHILFLRKVKVMKHKLYANCSVPTILEMNQRQRERSYAERLELRSFKTKGCLSKFACSSFSDFWMCLRSISRSRKIDANTDSVTSKVAHY